MTKYIDAGPLRVEIEKHIKEVKDAALKFKRNFGFFDAKLSGIYDVMAIIDSLQQEQPEVDLEKEIDRFWDSCIKHKNERGGNVIWCNKIEIEALARYFAEWGAIHFNARKEE